jgi:hypothetical protein
LKYLPRVVLAVVVLAGGIWLWRTFFPSPQAVITRELRHVAQSVTVRPGQGSLARIAGAQRVGSLCASNVEINIDVPGVRQQTVMSREDIVQNLTAAKLAGGLTVQFPDINVVVAGDGQNAQADVTLIARVPGQQDMVVQQMRIALRKIDGQWLITTVKTIRPFS